MKAETFETILQTAIEDAMLEEAGLDDDPLLGATPSEFARARVESFQDAGILTTDRGLVVRIGSTEFRVTIVRWGGNPDRDKPDEG